VISLPPLSPSTCIGAFAVLIYLFRDEGTENLALTIDVTGGNLPPVTASTDWIFVEAINTLRFPAPWAIADFQCLLRRLCAEGFYLFDADVKDPTKLGWARLRPQ
jgi:hypothetical protein